MKNLYYLVAFALFVSCRDPQSVRIYESNDAKDTVYLKDDFSESPTVIAPEATIYLYNGPITTNYLFLIKADKQGIFTLPYQPANTNDIHIVGEYTDSNSLLFRGITDLSTRNLYLTPIYKKGTLKVKTIDQQGNLINGMSVSLFVNEAQANAAKTSDQTGIQTAISNARGIAFFSNLEGGIGTTYFVEGRKGADYTDVIKVMVTSSPATTSPASQTFVTVADIQTVATTITSAAPLSLSLVNSSPVQLTVLVVSKDTPPSSLSGIDVYLLSSLAGIDLTGNITSIATKKTDSQGKAQFNKVSAGTYFVAARGTFISTTTNAVVVRTGIATSPGSSTLSSAIPVSFTSTTAVSNPPSVTVVIDVN